MNDVTKCPRCGADQPVGSTGGVCPRCAAGLLQATQTDIPGEGTGSFTPPTVEELAAKFPQLEILGLIGRGGMGAVYQARQKELDRLVALKILPPDIGRDAAFAERFTREARALAKLNHPGIVTIYDFGRADGLYFFLMEFVDGMNLRELLHRQRISSREALAIVPQICDALQFAHDQGIVHRDIKPENLLIDRRGRVKVADFGLAKLIGTEPDPASPADSPAGSPTLTEAGKVMGTPNYMSPEQLEHPEEVDHRADIYALGVVFYQMLTGELPEKQLQPPSRKVQIDVRLDEVVLRALEKQPDRRYQQASTMKLQVETIAQGPAGEVPSNAARVNQGVDYKSKATLFGLPWLHVATGQDPLTGRARIARGIFAIGGVAQGVVACGGVAMGGITLGGLSLGIFSYGGMAVGLLAFGGLGVGLLGACGGLAVAPVALGGEAIGWLAAGAKAIGTHVLDVTGSDEVARNFFNPWSGSFLKNAYIANYFLVVLTVFLASGVPMWLAWRSRARTPGGNRVPNQPLPAGTVEAWLALMDQGDYAGNWAAASVYFQRVMGCEKWISLGKTIRSPLGRVISRQLTTTRYKYLGTRVEVKYNTVFEGLAAAVETVTFMREPNGEWKSIGYLIRPAGFTESTKGGASGESPRNAVPVGDTQRGRLRKGWWMVAAILILALAVLIRPVAEHDGRWHPQRISQSTTSVVNPLALLRVTEVKRFKNIVVFRVVSDIGFPPHLLTAEFNGEDLTNLPMAYGSYEYTGPKLNCLLGPDHSRLGYGDGTSFVGNDLDGWLESVQPRPEVIAEPKPKVHHRHFGNPQPGPGELLYGFYLPDEEKAEMVVRQASEVLAGRTNYLGDGASVLLLFDLKRFTWLRDHNLDAWDHLTGSLRVAPDFDVSFGPVREKVLAWDEHQSPCLNLVSGQLEPLPTNLKTWSPPPDLPSGVSLVLPETYKLNRPRSPDVYVSGGTGLRGLSNEQWTNVAAAQVLTIASTITNNPPSSLVRNFFPATFVFKTRWGAAGVLQIDAFTNSPMGVRLRYKLVQSMRTVPDNTSQGDEENPTNTSALSSNLPVVTVHPAPPPPRMPAAELRIYQVIDEADTNVPFYTLTNFLDPAHFQGIRVSRNILMDGQAVDRAGWHTRADGLLEVEVELTEAGRQQFADITATNLNRRLAIVFQNRVVCVPVIRASIQSGSFTLPVILPKKQLMAMVQVLNEMNHPRANFKFGPEQEQVLPSLREQGVFLNLRENQLLTNAHHDPDSREFHDWQREQGADLSASADENPRVLLGYNLATVPAGSNMFNAISPAEVRYNSDLMNREPKPWSVLGIDPKTGGDTYYFRTQDDTWGGVADYRFHRQSYGREGAVQGGAKRSSRAGKCRDQEGHTAATPGNWG